MPVTTSVFQSAVDELFGKVKSLLGDIPPEADAKRKEYADLLFRLGGQVASGVMSWEAAQYELRQAKNGLIQAIGSIGLDVLGRKKAALEALISTGLSVLLKIAIGGILG